jgi:hypothetical protein
MNTQMSRNPEGVLDRLVRSAVCAGTPEQVADEARRVTAARRGARGTTSAERARTEAYFWGVIRRRALTGAAPAIVRIMVAASLASELREAGHAPEAIARALT